MPNVSVPEGKYLYGVIRCPEPRVFANRGIGERGDIVHTVNFRGLAVVVSDSPVVEYDSSRRNMMAHTRVLEEVMQEYTVLPVRFGIIAPSEDMISTQLLERRYDELCTKIGELDGRVELGLKAFWFEDVIFREVVEGDPAIRSLRDGLVGRSQEESYYERIRLGEMVEHAMARQREADAARILERLRPLTARTVTSPTITDRMVLNAAFLLEQEREAEFDKAIRGLDSEMGHRIMFKYVGPVPPYNFVNLVISWN